MDAVLKTQRLVLRPFEISDAPAFRSIVADPAVTRMTSSFPTQYDRLSAQGFIEIARIRTALGHAYDWAITEKDVLIGSMGLFRIGGHWEIGYALARTAWGRGLATEAVTKIAEAFRRNHPNQPLHASVFTDNPGSRHVLLKCGFKQDEAVTSGYSLGRMERHSLWNFILPDSLVDLQSSHGAVTALAASRETP